MQKDEKTLQINGFVGFYRFLSLNISVRRSVKIGAGC